MTAIKDLRMYEHVFLLNEHSGTCKLRKKAMKAIEQFCMHDGIRSEIIYMKDMEESRRIIRYQNEKPGEKIFYSIGGDGTLSSTINFLGEGKERKKLLNAIVQVIPTGTGNDFCRTIYPGKLPNYDTMLLSRNIDKIDLIQIKTELSEQLVVNGLSVGLDVRVMEIVEELIKRHKNKRDQYNKAILSALRENKPYHFHVTKDDVPTSVEMAKTLLAICNGRFYGKNKKISPNSELDDGYMEMIDVGYMKTNQLVWILGRLVLFANHLHTEAVTESKHKKIAIKSTMGKIIYQADGEIGYADEMHISCIPKILTLKK